MTKYTLEALKKKAKAIFDKNPEEQTLLATSDGNIFFARSANAAQMHSRSKGGLTIHTIQRSNDKPSENKVKLSAEERIAVIEKCESIEELNELLKEEKAKTVKAAGAKRIAKLEEEAKK